MSALPLKEIVGQSYRHLLNNLDLFVRAAGVWIALTVIVRGLFLGSAGPPPATPAEIGQMPTQMTFLILIDNIITMLGTTATFVFWHRFVQLGETRVGLAAPINRIVWRYIWIGIVFALIASLPAIAVFTLFGIDNQSFGFAILITLGFVIMLTARMMLVFPATAVEDRTVTFQKAWEKTRGHAFRILAGLVMTAVPFIVAGIILGSVINALGASVSLLAVLVESILQYAQATVFAGFMSYVYLDLTGSKAVLPAED